MSCPICKGDTVTAYRPFCSKRCADIDLGRWMSGGYALPSDEAQDPQDPGPAGGSERSDRFH